MTEKLQVKIPEFNKTPLNMTALVMEVLKTHFKFNSKRFKYTDNPKESRVIIQQAHNFKTDVVDKRPALYVKRGDISFQRVAFGDRLHEIPQDSITKYHKEERGTVTVQCLGNSGGEAELLADEVTDVLGLCETLIACDYNFLTFQLQSIGALSYLEEHLEIPYVPVTIFYIASKQWELELESRPIKKIRQTLNVIAC